MLSTQIQIAAFGDPSKLTINQLPMPELQNDQVLIKTAYAGVNPIDAKTRAGLGWAAEQNKDNLPWTPGYDCAGTVVASHSELFKPGQLVAGMIGFPIQGGCYGEHVIASAKECVLLPEGAPLEQAAGLPLAGLTAWQGLFQHGQLQAGEQVLISAAAGGVGHLAVQLAKQQGATVIALASAKHQDLLTSLGADKVIDYQQAGWAKCLPAIDLAFDLVGGDSGSQLAQNLPSGARFVTVPTLSAASLIEQATARGVNACGMLVQANQADLRQLFDLFNRDSLTVKVAHTFALQDAHLAHQQIETGRTQGKVLLRCE
ncbi:NADP-dependent oxidoreductase [Motilimonas pumila]|uniref:NADP-dependent oxidoreductase n=1 Tax=Motilimonas pumila TaxID=2303987 RepID=A0A418YKQ8_9GAMM|nr:NADP-dependent oxidoreductase [Motilimonas pumila]RJG51568.1 NADP-dependent oxidoreductase [Motilimonas pumila]